MAAIRCVYPQEYAALLRGAGEIKNIFSMFPSGFKVNWLILWRGENSFFC